MDHHKNVHCLHVCNVLQTSFKTPLIYYLEELLSSQEFLRQLQISFSFLSHVDHDSCPKVTPTISVGPIVAIVAQVEIKAFTSMSTSQALF